MNVDYGEVYFLAVLAFFQPVFLGDDVVDVFRDEGVDARVPCAAGYKGDFRCCHGGSMWFRKYSMVYGLLYWGWI